MALKERVQKRIDGMKVEGSWRMKLAVYGGAVLMVGGILLVAAVLVSSISTLRLKPKQILSQME